jgi:alpha-D-xyloside xylohydrolase
MSRIVYEDDNQTYDYEKGKYATYDLVWNDRDRSQTISARKGSFPGLFQQRRLDLVLMNPASATGAAPAAGKRMVNYTGVDTTVAFAR